MQKTDYQREERDEGNQWRGWDTNLATDEIRAGRVTAEEGKKAHFWVPFGVKQRDAGYREKNFKNR